MAIERSFNQEGFVWLVLDFQNFVLGDEGYLVDQDGLLKAANAGLSKSWAGVTTVDDDQRKKISSDVFVGATERKIAAVGKNVGADCVLTGSVYKKDGVYHAYLSAVRTQDTLLLATQEVRAGQWADLVQEVENAVASMIGTMAYPPMLQQAPTEKAIEESRILCEVARKLVYGKNQFLNRYQSARLFQAAAMIAQGTFMEDECLETMSISTMFNHPAFSSYRDDWKSVDLDEEMKAHNQWVLD